MECTLCPVWPKPAYIIILFGYAVVTYADYYSDQSDMDLTPQCKRSGSEYKNSSVCGEGVRRHWANLLAVPANQETCNFDQASGKIVCDTDYACHGGQSFYVDDVRTSSTMEYDCSKCNNFQRRPCCDKCHELQRHVAREGLMVAGSAIHSVVCHHCDVVDLEGKSLKPQVTCQHDASDGTFKCSFAEHCEDGKRIDRRGNWSYKCLVTTCDSCTETFTKAKCCLTCLNHYCNSPLTFQDRRVCRGCEVHTSHLSSWADNPLSEPVQHQDIPQEEMMQESAPAPPPPAPIAPPAPTATRWNWGYTYR